jgi:hypothetical protein
MELKHSIKRTAMVVGILALVSVTAFAQENRSEISIQGTGFFTKDTDGNGIQQHATDAGGFLVGYRYSINRWLAAEANYGYDRNTVRIKARTMQLWAAGTLKNFSRCCGARASPSLTHVQCFRTRQVCCALSHTLQDCVIESGGGLLPTRPRYGQRS